MADKQTGATEAGTIADLARKATSAASTVKTESGREFLILPADLRSTDVTDPHGLQPKKPIYIKQAVTVQTADSLVEYVNKYKTADTMLFADVDTNKIVAHIDYHRAGSAEHIAHSASMQLRFSEEWSSWRKIDGELMKQLDFARFIEENSADVVAPSGGELLEVCRDLQAVRGVNFKRAVRTNTDHENFEFVDNTEMRSKTGVEVPTKFELSIPVYFGERNVPLQAFLRWNLVGEVLALGVKLHRHEHVRQAMFKEIVTAAADRTSCPAVYGTI